MLVLSRKQGEEIVIGDTIRVTVVAIGGNQVRLGFIAPADVLVLRAELTSSPDDCGPQADNGDTVVEVES
jgi:carbon storage regulator